MKSRIRLLVGLAVFSSLIVVLAVVGARGGTDTSLESARPATQGPEVNLIAYVDLQSRIRTVTPLGSDRRLISPREGFFGLPAWSPDAQSLLFSGVVGLESGDPKLSLLAFDISEGTSHELYVGEPGVVGLVAEGIAHYPVWAPDSRRVAFIASTSRGLSLFIDDLEEDVQADLVLDGGPLWMSWSPSSRYLLIHRGAQHFLVDSVAGTLASQLDIESLGYRVPAWNPQTGSATLASGDGTGAQALFTAEVAGNVLTKGESIAEVPSDAAFVWSPNGDLLAVAKSSRALVYQDLFLRVFRELALIPRNDTRQPIELRENIVAYFWSPDGAKLAYVTLSEAQGVLRWMVLDILEDKAWPLVEFLPSRDQLTAFVFFDQFAYSHSLWSPDSKSLVFAGSIRGGAVPVSYGSAQGAQGSQIFVVGAGRNPSVNSVAEGTVGFWSPR